MAGVDMYHSMPRIVKSKVVEWDGYKLMALYEGQILERFGRFKGLDIIDSRLSWKLDATKVLL